MKDNTKKILAYLGTVFLLSWLFIGAFHWRGGEMTGISAVVVGVVYMYMPLFAVLLLNYHFFKSGEHINGISFKINIYWLFALLVMPVFALATLFVSVQFFGFSFDANMGAYLNSLSANLSADEYTAAKQQLDNLPLNPLVLIIVSSLIAGSSVNALAAFGEEIGWRGYLHNLFRGKSFFSVAIITGFVWGLWHAPLILLGHNYPQHPQQGVFYMIVFCVLLSPIFTYVRIKTKSVIAVSVMHGVLNAGASLSVVFLDRQDDLTAGVTGLSGFIVLIALISIILVWDIFIKKEKITLSRIR